MKSTLTKASLQCFTCAPKEHILQSTRTKSSRQISPFPILTSTMSLLSETKSTNYVTFYHRNAVTGEITFFFSSASSFNFCSLFFQASSSFSICLTSSSFFSPVSSKAGWTVCLVTKDSAPTTMLPACFFI